MDVPCGMCTACCRSSLFIHIGANETQTLARIPGELLFPAPGRPNDKVMGFDENGQCPMFQKNECSIYEHRPLTCRQFDCRVFAITELKLTGENKSLINRQIGRWKFAFPAQEDTIKHLAVQAASQFLQNHTDCFPAGILPDNKIQLAVLALKVFDVFLKHVDESETALHPFSNNQITGIVDKICKRLKFEVPAK